MLHGVSWGWVNVILLTRGQKGSELWMLSLKFILQGPWVSTSRHPSQTEPILCRRDELWILLTLAGLIKKKTSYETLLAWHLLNAVTFVSTHDQQNVCIREEFPGILRHMTWKYAVHFENKGISVPTRECVRSLPVLFNHNLCHVHYARLCTQI